MSSTAPSIGLFGKLPAHGDFVTRNLPGSFMSVWDEWLQRCVRGTQETLGDAWLDVYLTSPLWRFALSSGVVDEQVWAGLIMPSVDSVGRYFPLTIVSRLPRQTNGTELMAAQSAWFEKQEMLALQALEEGATVDELYDALQGLAAPAAPAYRRDEQAMCWRAAPEEIGYLSRQLAVPLDDEAQQPMASLPLLTDWLLSRSFASYSVWHTQGSEYVQPSFLVVKGLPDADGVTAMLDGRWGECSWQSPYILQAGAMPAVEPGYR